LWKFYIFATLKDIFALYEISKSKESSGSMARFATIDGKG
jgi:Gpi18-like mannosyltransferase